MAAASSGGDDDDQGLDNFRANNQVLKYTLSDMLDRDMKRDMRETSKGNLEMINHGYRAEALRARQKLADYALGKRILPEEFVRTCRPSPTSFYRSWSVPSIDEDAQKWRRMTEIWVIEGAPCISLALTYDPGADTHPPAEVDIAEVDIDPTMGPSLPPPPGLQRQSRYDAYNPENQERVRKEVASELQKFSPGTDKDGRLVVGNFFTARLLHLQFIQIYGNSPTFKIITQNYLPRYNDSTDSYRKFFTRLRRQVRAYLDMEPAFRRELCVVDILEGKLTGRVPEPGSFSHTTAANAGGVKSSKPIAKHRDDYLRPSKRNRPGVLEHSSVLQQGAAAMAAGLKPSNQSHAGLAGSSDNEAPTLFQITNFGKHIYTAFPEKPAGDTPEIKVVFNNSVREYPESILHYLKAGEVVRPGKLILVLPESVCELRTSYPHFSDGTTLPRFLTNLTWWSGSCPKISDLVSKIVIRARTNDDSKRFLRNPDKEKEMKMRWGLSENFELWYEGSEGEGNASAAGAAFGSASKIVGVGRLLRRDFKTYF